MNIPNKLTVARIFMIPLFLFFFFMEYTITPSKYFWALVVFTLASLTDTLDGIIARKYNLVTDFGKLMDPLADKVLVMAAMIALSSVSLIHPVIVTVILIREFLVSAIRQIAASRGHVLAADNWGKMKTVFQMIWICILLLNAQMLDADYDSSALMEGIVNPMPVVEIAALILTVLVVATTVFSGVNYTWKNRELFSNMR